MSEQRAARAGYASRGLIGLLTPQANTTVEAEANILLPRGMVACTARLTSKESTMHARLVDYLARIEATIDQFGSMAPDAIGFACTGSSYLVGRDSEAALFERLTQQRKARVTSSALAIVAMLNAIRAKRIALVSPYDEALTQASVRYWESHGFSVAHVEKAAAPGAAGNAHPIYGLPNDAAQRAVERLPSRLRIDAVLLLGTGLPTLAAILDAQVRSDGHSNEIPVLSSMLALVWHCVCACDATQVSDQMLTAWLDGVDWRAAFEAAS